MRSEAELRDFQRLAGARIAVEALLRVGAIEGEHQRTVVEWAQKNLNRSMARTGNLIINGEQIVPPVVE